MDWLAARQTTRVESLSIAESGHLARGLKTGFILRFSNAGNPVEADILAMTFWVTKNVTQSSG
jgi:hypothetical protein